MEFFDLIKNRRSVRNFDPDCKVSRDNLNKILEAGRIAPSAANRQPWKFIIVESESVREKLNQCYGRNWFSDAPQILVVVGFPEQAWVRDDGLNALQIDLSIAMDHMILAAEALGISTCWIAAFDDQKLRTALTLNENEAVYCITPLGYPKKGYQKKEAPPRKEFAEIVEFV